MSGRPQPTFLPPAAISHRLFNISPDAFHNLSIPPPRLSTSLTVPFINRRTKDTSSPSLDGSWQLLSSPSDVDAQGVAEKVGCLLPLVGFELPRLARREDGNNTLPVVGLELFRRVDENKAQWSRRVD